MIAFHPSFILFSGSINNDVLSVAFLLGAVLWTLKWYEKQTWEGILKIALYMGLGMMTKLSVALAAFPIGAVFLVVLVRRCKAKNWRIFGQYGAFLGICAPLGLWYPIRNLVRFGVPLNYVQEMSVKSDQYLGDQSFLSRALDFSPHQVAKVFEQWLHYDASGYNEYNPLITLLKNAVFGGVHQPIHCRRTAAGVQSGRGAVLDGGPSGCRRIRRHGVDVLAQTQDAGQTAGAVSGWILRGAAV